MTQNAHQTAPQNAHQTAPHQPAPQAALGQRLISLRGKAPTGGAISREEQLKMRVEAERLAAQDSDFRFDNGRPYARHRASAQVGSRWVAQREAELRAQGHSLSELSGSCGFQKATCSHACPFSAHEDPFAEMCLPGPSEALSLSAMGLETWLCHERPAPCAGLARSAAHLGLRLRGIGAGEHGRMPGEVLVEEISKKEYQAISEENPQSFRTKELSHRDTTAADPWTAAARWFGFRHDLMALSVPGEQPRYFKRG